MAENSPIEWTDHTFNPWRGCTAISAACAYCYAKVLVEGRLQQNFSVRTRAAASTWKQPLAWNRKALREGRRPRVFCASLADVFDAEVPEEWRDELFALIAVTPHLDWLLLTKRPKVARDYLNRRYGLPAVWLDAAAALTRSGIIPPSMSACAQALEVCSRLSPSTPLPNVWLGTTVEDQKMADLRIPLLLETPAAVRFLSMEPLLGPVRIPGLYPVGEDGIIDTPALDWVITGGESGPGARPTHPDWFRSIRDQCAAAGVPHLHKQNGEWSTGFSSVSTGAPVFRRFETFDQWVNKASTWVNGGICLDVDGRRLEVGADFMAARDAGKFPVTIMHRVGKKAAGRHLDGVLHDGYPRMVGHVA